MRRLPFYWSTTLSKLGLKLVRRKRRMGRSIGRGYGRRSTIESLETRQLLTTSPWSGADLVLGDFDGDGNQDRLGSMAATVGQVEAWSLDTKSSSASGTTDSWLISRSTGNPGTLPTLNESLIGDFNGDGRDDILSRSGGTTWYMIQSRATTNVSYKGEFVVYSWGTIGTTGGWATPIVGDFNGDGRDDIAAFDESNPADKQWQVFISSGAAFSTQSVWSTQNSLAPSTGSVIAGDVNGDGRDDLLFRKSGTQEWAVAVSDGSRFNVVVPPAAVATTWTTGRLGDFDGNGAQEFLGWNANLGRWETLDYSDYRGLTLDISWGSELGNLAGSENVHVGDTNRDGCDDLVIFDSTAGIDKWKVLLSKETANRTNSLEYLAATSEGTNDWDRWFKDWDWGPAAAPNKFLNIDAPYQKFLHTFSEVYNNIELDLYPGFMKGLEAASQTKAANAWEQAALLVDRLEKSGFSVPDVEIASGNIEVQFETLKSWLGLESRLSVYNAIKIGLDGNAVALNSAGVDLSANSGAVIDAQLSKVRFRHAWVRAKVPTTLGWTIIDIDPSWKTKDLQPGKFIDLPVGSGPYPGNRGTFDEFGYLASTGDQLPLEYYEDQIAKYLADNNIAASLAEVPQSGRIVRRQFATIPSEFNTNVTLVGGVTTYDNFADIVADEDDRAALTHRVEISLQRDATSLKFSRRIDVNEGTELFDYKGFTGHTSLPVTLTDSNVSNYGGGPGTADVDEQANSVSLQDIISRSVPIDYTVTPHTVLEFEFYSDSLGSYAIGWDSNNTPNDNGDNPNAAKFFTVFNPAGEGWYNNLNTVEKVPIPVGKFLEGSTSQAISRIVFAIDPNSSGVWSTCTFKNVRIYEAGNELTGTGASLKVVQWGDSFKALLAQMDITKRTVLKFDMNVIQEGRFHGIGVDYDGTAGNGGNHERLFYLSGTNPSGFNAQPVAGSPFHGTGSRTVSIPIGDHVGNIDWLNRLVFVTDGGKVEFSNISLFEGPENAFSHWTREIVVPDTPPGTATHDVQIWYERSNNGLTSVYTPYLSVNGNAYDRYGDSDGFFYAGENSTIKVQHRFPAAFAAPGNLTALDRLTTYSRDANQVHAFVTDANQYSSKFIAELQHNLNEQQLDVYRRRTEGGAISALEVSNAIGALLNYTGSKYWHELNRGASSIADLMHTLNVQTTVGSGLITSESHWISDPNVGHLNLPNIPLGTNIDIPNASFAAIDIRTNVVSHANEVRQLIGYNASALEHAILEEVTNTKSISTIRGLKEAYAAASNGDYLWVFESRLEDGQRKIYRRGSIGTTPNPDEPYELTGGDPFNVALIRSGAELTAHEQRLRDSVADFLENKDLKSGTVNAVITVAVPNKRSIVENWHGSVYLAEVTQAGGRSSTYAIVPDVGPITYGGGSGDKFKLENKQLASGAFSKHPFAGDPVNVANGNMFRDELDFTFTNPIIPLDFSRHYDSQNKLDVGFGVGWVHGFTGFVYEEQDPVNSGDVDFVWLRGSGERHTFEDANYTLPNTLFGDVEKDASGLTRFLDRSGTQYVFQPIAGGFTDLVTGKKVVSRLVAIKDATGNQGVTITYDDVGAAKSVRVKEVRSASTPSRYLQFTYSANGIEVRRFDGNQAISTWAYALTTSTNYVGKRLAQVKHANLSGNTTNYLYFEDGTASRRGLIMKIVEPNLESHSYEYYANGRVFRVTDGRGEQQSFNYNLFRNLTEFTGENGNVETYIHQDNGLLLKQIHGDRSRLEYTWGPPSVNGSAAWEEFLMQSSTHERGAKESFDYFDFSPSTPSQRPGELRQSTAKDGTVTTYTYKPHASISSVATTTETPQNGTALQTAEYTYDDFGHVLTAKDAEGHITNYEYYDTTAPAHLRGLRKSETLPKGVPNQSLASGEVYEAVPWKVLSSAFVINGDTISVQLRTPGSGQYVVADAIRIDRIDKNGVFTRVIDSSMSATSDFRIGSGGGSSLAGSGDAYGGSYIRIGGTVPEQAAATWIFRDLEPGTYRISASWQANTSNSAASYWMHQGLPDGTPEATATSIVQAVAPADFRSYQTIFEYDGAGNITRSVTEGLPSGRSAYDRLGNLIYEEDATGVAESYTYDELSRLVRSDVVQSQTISFVNAQRFTFFGDTDSNPENWQIEGDGATLYMYGKNRIAVPLNHEITPDTILEFDFEAPATPFAGQWYDISFINALNQPHALTFKLGGTDPQSLGTRLEFNNYVHGSGPKHYRIPIGQQYGTTQLTGSGKYVVFTNFDNISNGLGRGESCVSNVRIYEATNPDLVVGTSRTTYDFSGRVASQRDAIGYRTKFEYDAAGRLSRTIFPDFTFAAHNYDAFGNCIATTDELGRTTRYVYDDRNRLIQTVYADGNSTRIRYDGFGQVVSTFDERGNETRSTYDKAGRLLTTIAAPGQPEEARTVNKYDNRGRRFESVDANGIVTKYKYDSLDRLIQTTVLDRSHASPNDTAETTPTLSKAPVYVSTIHYDSNGNIVRTTVFDPGRFAAADYANLLSDAASLISVPNEEQNKVQIVRTAYDAYGRVSKVTNTDGTSTSMVHDAAGRVRWTFDELGRKTEYQYDQFGRSEKTILPDPDGLGPQQRYTRYDRDPAGNIRVESVYVGSDAGGNSNGEIVNGFAYDYRGRLIRSSDAHPTVESRFEYDVAGNRVATIDPEGNAAYTRYDKRNRNIADRLADPDGPGPQFAPVTRRSYDEVGNVDSTTDALFNTTTYEYDPLNRLKKETRSDSRIADDSTVTGDVEFVATPTNYERLADFYGGDVTYWINNTTGTANWKFENVQQGNYQLAMTWRPHSSYDTDTQVTITVNGQPPVSAEINQRLKGDYYSIHGDKLLDWTNVGSLLTNVPDGATIIVALAATGQAVMADAVRLDRSSTTEYAYDKSGNLIAQTDSRGYVTSNQRDELGRQILAKTPDPDIVGSGNLPLESRSIYDGYGNVVQVIENRGTAATNDDRTKSFEYDRRNRLIKEVFNVNVDTGSDDNVTTIYEYDAVGNRTLITDAEGYQTRFRYDDADRLIDKYLNYGENRPDPQQTPIQLGALTAAGTGSHGLSDGILTLTGDKSVWATIPTYTVTHRTVLEFTLQADDLAATHVVGFDTDASYSTSEKARYFELGGFESTPIFYTQDFRDERLSTVPTTFHIPIGQYLTSEEKAAGLAITRLAFRNLENRTGLSTDDISKSRFSNITLYESDEVRTVTTYDARGNVKTTREASDPRNVLTSYRYDRHGRVDREIRDEAGLLQRVRDYTYDKAGNVTTTTTWHPGNEQRVTAYEYDRLNRRIKTTLPDPDGNSATPNGLISSFIYDVAGNLIAETNGENETTRRLYDSRGNVTSEIDGNGDETRYRYDSAGNLTTVIDAEQNITRNKYDGLNRLTEETITATVNGTSQQLSRTYGYKADGNLDRRIDRNGRLTLFKYDGLDRKIQDDGFAGSTGASGVTRALTWEYDKLGQVTTQVDSNTLVYVPGTGGTVFDTSDDIVNTYQYDGLGRIAFQTNYDTSLYSFGLADIDQNYDYVFEYEAGAFHKRIRRGQSNGISYFPRQVAQTTSEFDRLGQLTSIKDEDVAGSYYEAAIAAKSASFQYDTAGNLHQIHRTGTASSYLDYDKANRLTSITHDLAIDIVHSYGYDNASRVSSFNTAGTGAATRGYTYDDAGQLTGKTGGIGPESYTYDDNGNREMVSNSLETGQDYVPGLANRLASDGTYSYTYDNEGNQIRRTPLELPNISSSNPVVNYYYDHRNRLTSIRYYASTADALANNGQGQNAVKTVAYTYDAAGRRIKRVLDSDGAGPFLANSQYFVYDGDQLSMRFDQAGAGNVELTHRYLHGPLADQALVDEAFTPGANDQAETLEVFWLLGDHQNTVHDIIGAGGTQRKHIEYDSFGRVTSSQVLNGSSVDQLFYFQGQERDAVTKLQQHGDRWYSPDTGRWMSEDPVGLEGGDANLYRYVGNSPLNFTDPSGTTQAGNPYTSLNIYNGGYTTGSVAANKPFGQYVASGGIGLSGGTFGTIGGNSLYNANPNALVSSALAAPAPSFVSVFDTGFNGSYNGISTSYIGPTREQILDAELNPHGRPVKIETINPTIYGDKFRRPAAALDDIARNSNNPLAAGTAQFIKPAVSLAGNLAGGFIDTIFPPSDPTHLVTYADGTRNLYIGEGPSTRSYAEFGLLATGGYPRNLTRPPAPKGITAESVANWVDEGGNLRAGGSPGMRPDAYDFQSGTLGARSSVLSGRSQAPYVEFIDGAGNTIGAKFDGVYGRELIDRKLNPYFSPKAVDGATRQAAVAKHYGLEAVWELPNQKAVDAANRFMQSKNITGIKVRLAR